MSDAPIEALRAEHGVLVGLKAGANERVICRLPTLAELDECRAQSDKGQFRAAWTKLFLRCCVWPEDKDELMRSKPALASSLGPKLWELAGTKGPLLELEEHEIEEPIATEMVRFSDRGPLHVLRYTQSATKADVTVLVREMKANEVDVSIKSTTFGASRDLVRRLMLWPSGPDGLGDVAEIDSRSPGLFQAIERYSLELVGLAADVEAGEV